MRKRHGPLENRSKPWELIIGLRAYPRRWFPFALPPLHASLEHRVPSASSPLLSALGLSLPLECGVRAGSSIGTKSSGSFEKQTNFIISPMIFICLFHSSAEPSARSQSEPARHPIALHKQKKRYESMKKPITPRSKPTESLVRIPRQPIGDP